MNKQRERVKTYNIYSAYDKRYIRESKKGRETRMAKVGDKVTIIQMEGEPQYTGKSGIILDIDSIGQLHGTWGGCALIPGIDNYEVEEREEAK